MKPVFLGALLALAACTAPSHPLTYVSPSDPVWWVNPPEAPMAAAERAPIAEPAPVVIPPPPLDPRIQSSMVIK